jgi:hypothetical protein
MAKSSRQTFRKRQRELAKKQKKEDKAKRLAARRAGESDQSIEEMPDSTEKKKPGLVITVKTSESKPSVSQG